jgi:hypothetical protein
MPAAIVLSNRTFHSSGVKFDLSVMGADSFTDCNALAGRFARGRDW